MSTVRIGLDNPVFAGRLRAAPRSVAGSDRGQLRARPIADINPRRVERRQLPVQRSDPLRFRASEQVHCEGAEKLEFEVPVRRFAMPKILIGMAAVLFVFGSVVAWQGFSANREIIAQMDLLSNGSGQGEAESVIPDEDEPEEGSFTAYQVAPDLPRFIAIDKIDVKARVRRLGVDGNNVLKAPANIFDVGWYENSAKPGDAGGALLLDGHVHGPTKPGVFADLKHLEAGDEISIERGDGMLYTFTVVKKQAYQKDNVDMAAAMVSADPARIGLNIITCDGRYNSRESTYDDRLVVFAVLK